MKGWKKDFEGNYPPEQEEAWKLFRVAVVKTFNSSFGEDPNDNEAWGRLCVQIGIVPIPAKMKDRRKVGTRNHSDAIQRLTADLDGC